MFKHFRRNIYAKGNQFHLNIIELNFLPLHIARKIEKWENMNDKFIVIALVLLSNSGKVVSSMDD